MLTSKSTSGLEIKAAQITEKATKAAAEADQALAILNLVKSDNTKTVEEIENSVELASNARNKADKLIAEAQQLWELVSPSENNSSSATVEVERQPIIQTGGLGAIENKQTINTAKQKIQALSSSVIDAKRIIKERRAKNQITNIQQKEAQIKELKERIAAATVELDDLRRRIGKGGENLDEAHKLERKVKKLTDLLKQITGDEPDLEKGVRDHLIADSEKTKASAEEIARLNRQLLTLEESHNQELIKLREQLRDAIALGQEILSGRDNKDRVYKEQLAKNKLLEEAARRTLLEQQDATASLKLQLKLCEDAKVELRRSSVDKDSIIREKEQLLQEANNQNNILSADIERLLAQLPKPAPTQLNVKPSPRVLGAPKAKLPDFMKNTAASRLRYNSTQPQLDRRGDSRIARGVYKGGKKGARLTRVQKKIIPL